MKELKNIKRIIALLSTSGLILLLLLSPCKVRNYVQTELGLSKTEVLNKSISTINSCQISPKSDITFIFSKRIVQDINLLTTNTLDFISANISSQKTKPYLAKTTDIVSIVPLYILHQNFKVYLSLFSV